jgi:hypothetical protein
MLRTLPAACIAAAALTFACAVQAGAPLLDPAFGEAGMVRIDSAAGVPRDDRAVGLCPGPNDTELTISTRMDPAMLMLARVRRDGSLDPAFGDGGRVERMIEMPGQPLPRSLCLLDGRVEIAYGSWNGTVEVLRFLADGQPDAAFGNGGRLSITVSSLPGANSGAFSLRGMDRGPAGEILLGGTLAADEQSYGRAALLRVRQDGTLRDARIFDETEFPRGAYIAGSAYATTGDLWIAGGYVADVSAPWFRMHLNGVTLDGSGPILGEADYGVTLRINGGRMVEPDVMVLAAVRLNPSGPALPMLLVLRSEGVSNVMLPAPPADASMADSVASGLLPLPDGKVMYGGTTNHEGLYFARAVIGATPAEDSVDTTFEDGGAAIVPIPGTPAGCIPLQALARMSTWGGVPVFVASARADCLPGGESDVVVGRFSARDAVFEDGFDLLVAAPTAPSQAPRRR